MEEMLEPSIGLSSTEIYTGGYAACIATNSVEGRISLELTETLNENKERVIDNLVEAVEHTHYLDWNEGNIVRRWADLAFQAGFCTANYDFGRRGAYDPHQIIKNNRFVTRLKEEADDILNEMSSSPKLVKLTQLPLNDAFNHLPKCIDTRFNYMYN